MNTGERKVRELIAKFGPDTLRQGMSDLLDYAEHQAREILRSIPDGEYFFADYADEDGPDGYPCAARGDAAHQGRFAPSSTSPAATRSSPRRSTCRPAAIRITR